MDESTLSDLLQESMSLPDTDTAALAELAQRALSLGHPLLACEWLLARRELCEREPRLRYLLALAEVRIGGYREAVRWLAPLLDASLDATLRVDVLSLAGRIAKDCWQRLPDGEARERALADAVARYRQAWDESSDPFPGINAASLLRLQGDHHASSELAQAVERCIEAAPDALQPHWREATLGEALLLLGRDAESEAHYARAQVLAGARHGDVASMRRQLRLLGAVLPQAEALRAGLRLPTVLAFTGHMIDALSQSQPRFPAILEGVVARAIERALEDHHAGVGVCSAACGGDLLFVEAMLARGAEVNLILPFAREDFIATSVAVGGEAWVARFEAAMRQVNRIEYAVPERHLGDDALFAHAGMLIQGAARLRARDFDDEPRLLAVVDEAGGGGPGGSLDTLSTWRLSGLRVDLIELATLRGTQAVAARADVGEVRPTPSPEPNMQSGLHREVRSMLFADVVGYSRLSEEHTPAFLLGFLARVAKLVDALEPTPELVNTWGDGLFMVFADAEPAADFALRLRDLVASVDWAGEGLPAGLQLRIGLHVGPVYPAEDPLLHRPNVFGTQVTRAARIEPVTAADSVFISAEAAYALAAVGDDEFCADYLGSLPLAKNYGSQPMYRLRRAGDLS